MYSFWPPHLLPPPTLSSPSNTGATSFNWPVNVPASLMVNAQDGQDMFLTWFNGQYFTNGQEVSTGMPAWLDSPDPIKSKTSIKFSVTPPGAGMGDELSLWVAYQKDDGGFVCQTIYTIKFIEGEDPCSVIHISEMVVHCSAFLWAASAPPMWPPARLKFVPNLPAPAADDTDDSKIISGWSQWCANLSWGSPWLLEEPRGLHGGSTED